MEDVSKAVVSPMAVFQNFSHEYQCLTREIERELKTHGYVHANSLVTISNISSINVSIVRGDANQSVSVPGGIGDLTIHVFDPLLGKYTFYLSKNGLHQLFNHNPTVQPLRFSPPQNQVDNLVLKQIASELSNEKYTLQQRNNMALAILADAGVRVDE